MLLKDAENSYPQNLMSILFASEVNEIKINSILKHRLNKNSKAHVYV
jgi:hypothetical protein